jgi:adenylylsulfate kinase-like enzyme
MAMKSYLFWITGLSGSGKTTFSNLLKNKFDQLSIPNILIDGDIIRELFGDNKKYDKHSRLETAYKYSKLCSFLINQNINVICSTISLFHEIQTWNRKNISNYYEIFIKRDLNTLIDEDNKNIYKKAISKEIKNVVGIDIKAEYPSNPEMILDNVEQNSLDNYINKIVKFCQTNN